MAASAWIKLSLLAHGVSTSLAFDTWFAGTSGYVRRRNFYNSPDWRNGLAPGLPQEILLDALLSVTVAVKRYGHSAWTLTWSPEAGLTHSNQDPPRNTHRVCWLAPRYVQ